MLRCIAIDDEPIALTIIERYCERLGGIEVATFTNPMEGLVEVKRQQPDLLLLDIEMGGVNGVELAREIPPRVNLIFTTAYAQFALDGFELNAVDYLHKPFSYVRFERAIEKARGRIVANRAVSSSVEDMITVKVEYQSVRVSRASIEYIVAMDNYVVIHHGEARPLMTQMSMKQVMEMLPVAEFMRVHKSYILPRASVASFTRSQVQLKRGGATIPVGRTYQADFVAWIEER